MWTRSSSACSGDERRIRSQFDVEPKLAFDALNELVVALGRLLDDLLVSPARPALKDGEGVRTGGIAKLPAVAVDNIADQIADDRRVGLASTAAKIALNRLACG